MVIPPGGAPSMIPLPVSASAIVVSSGKGGNGGLPPGGKTDENAWGIEDRRGGFRPAGYFLHFLEFLRLTDSLFFFLSLPFLSPSLLFHPVSNTLHPAPGIFPTAAGNVFRILQKGQSGLSSH